MRGLNFLYKAENTYEYDGNNYRVFKQTPSEKTYYSYDGSGNLRFERRGRTEINYIYDAGGIRGMKVTVPTDDPSTYYASSEFYYVKDSLGNIRVILDKNGNIMVEYNYDAWGNFVAEKVRKACIGSVTVDLVSLNAFTYRGYYYDKESGLYYLINRYYDPVTGRFISPDDVGYLDFESFFGTNRYAYCLDNPVMYSDASGLSPLPWWGKLLIGIAVIAVLAVATIATAGVAGVGVGAAFAAGFAGSAIGVGASGAAVTIAAGAFAGAVVGASIGFVGGAIGGAIRTGTWMGALEGASSGFMWGSITGAITGGIRSGINYARTTPLFRTVNAKELSSIKTTRTFSSNGTMESKWFATNKLNVFKWGKEFGQTDYVGVRVLKSSLKNAYFNSFLDGIGAAYCLDIDLLNTIIRGIWFF